MREFIKKEINTGKQCPYCSSQSKLASSSEIYDSTKHPDYGWFYQCKKCEAYVGCHSGTTIALGRLANKELRYLKGKTHEAFDKLWKKPYTNKGALRTLAYRWLALQMSLPVEETHIGQFDENQCKSVCMIASQTHLFEQYLKQQL